MNLKILQYSRSCTARP